MDDCVEHVFDEVIGWPCERIQGKVCAVRRDLDPVHCPGRHGERQQTSHASEPEHRSLPPGLSGDFGAASVRGNETGLGGGEGVRIFKAVIYCYIIKKS